MRTLIDIADSEVRALDALGRASNQSHAALVRGAIAGFLERHRQNASNRRVRPLGWAPGWVGLSGSGARRVVKALFDTNILIDYLDGEPKADTELRRFDGRCISIVTWMEVMVGADAAV